MSKAKPSARRKARRFTVQALYQWQLAGGSASSIEAQFRADNDLRKTDAEFFHDLLHGIYKQSEQLDQLFIPHLDRPYKEIDPIELAILRIGTFEMKERPDVPYKVVISEGVELAKTFGATDSYRYVNGVLDRLAPALREAEVNAQR